MPQDLSAWLTKEQAAAALGVSTKTIEKLAKAKRLQQQEWKNPATGARKAVYHPHDVEQLHRERNPAATPFVVPPASEADDVGHALVATPPAPIAELLPEVLQAFFVALRAVGEKSQNGASGSHHSEKLFLTLDEAAAVSGLPRGYLRRLVREGRLEVTPTRPRLVRRRDLEAL